MARTVSVELEAKVVNYIAGMEEAEKATDNVEEKVEGLGITAEGAGEGLGKLGKKAEEAGVKARAAGREVDEMKDELKSLDRQIAETEASIVTLNRAFAQTSNKNFLKEIRDEKKGLSDLKNTRTSIDNELKKLTPDKFGTKFTNGFEDLLNKGPLNPTALKSIGILGLALAPFIGAAVSGAVVGTVGAGGIIGGIALAARDQRVQTAWSNFTQGLSSELKTASAPFVDVSIQAIGAIGGAVKDIKFGQIFGDAAKEAGPLIAGLATAIHGLGDGITELIHNSGPEVKALGAGIGEIGTALGDGLAELSHGGGAAADGLKDLFVVVDGGIRLVFGLIDGLTRLYGAAERINSLTGGGILANVEKWQGYKQAVTGAVSGIVEQARAGKGAFDQYGHAILTTGEALQSYADKADAAATAGHSLFDSATDVGSAMANAKKAIEANGKTLDVNTEKGRANRTALSQVANSLSATYKAYVDLNGETAESSRIAATNRDKFIDVARQMGLTKKQAADLATTFGLLPVAKTTDFHANTHDAEARIEALKEKTDRIPRNISVKVHYSETGTELLNAAGHRVGGYKAEGGPVKAGVAYVVGEHRPEVFVPDVSGKIVPSLGQYTASMPASAMSTPTRMSPVGAPTQKIIVEHRTVVDFANADSAMGQAMIKLYRTNAGVRTTTVRALGLKASA